MKYDYIFISNTPSFYKINLYNELCRHLSIKVYFIGQSSTIRNQDFCNGTMNFEYKFINKESFENRNKLLSFILILKNLASDSYSYLALPGWEIFELCVLMCFHPKKKNAIVIESSIRETNLTGFIRLLKKYIVNRCCIAFPSGLLQKDILDNLNFNGLTVKTHGVGIINYHNIDENLNNSVNLCCRQNSNQLKKSYKFKYLYVGRLSEEKNLVFLINVFNNLKKDLTIVGDGPQMLLLKNIAENNIKFLGYVDNINLKKIYCEHDIFILPSISEPWGLVIDEAIYFNLPVIVSNNVGCVDDMVTSGKTGVDFQYDSSRSLISSIINMENNYLNFYNNVLNFSFTDRDRKQLNSYLSIFNKSS